MTASFRRFFKVALVVVALAALAGCDPIDPCASPTAPGCNGNTGTGSEANSGQSITSLGTTCSYLPYGQGGSYQIGAQASLTPRQQWLIQWFNGWAISRNPYLTGVYLPILTLVGEANARGGLFGIAFDPAWFAQIGEAVSLEVLAHELGHVSQAYRLVSVDATLLRYGQEGQADYFAGSLLRAAGFSQSELESQVLPFVSKLQGSSSHPDGPVRARLVSAGYYGLAVQ